MHQSSVPSDITPLYFSKLKHYILWSKEPIKEQFFLDIRVLESKFVKFLMSVLKWKVNPLHYSSLHFALFFIAMTHNSFANVKVIPFLLWTKGCQSPNFDIFKCSGKHLPNFSILFSNQSLQCRERWLHCTFVALAMYTLVTRSQLKHKYFRISNARVKICEVPQVNFKATSQFLFSFCIILHCHDT